MVSYVKKKHQDYDLKYYQKLQYKRSKSKSFNSEYIQKQNAGQQKCRRLKKAAQQTPTNATESTTTATEAPSNATEPPTDRTILRKAEGVRRRRAYTRKLKNQSEKLSNEIKVLRKENSKLKKILSQQHSEDIETNDVTPTVSPAKLFINNISPRAKTRATKRLIDKKEELPRGSVSKLRQKLGINLSNDYSSPSNTSSTLQKDIEEFLCQDDVTKQAPDKKKHLNGKQIRYLLNHLSTIHQRFIFETGNNCHYSTFTPYIPDYVLKPSTNDWGTCLCIVCLSPQMKLEKLQRTKFLYTVLKTLLPDGVTDITDFVTDEIKTKDFLDNLVKLKDEQFNITYTEWIKKKYNKSNVPVSTKTTFTSSIVDFITKFSKEINDLVSHINRVHQQFRAAKEAGQIAMEQEDTITIHLDWSENFKLKQARQEKDAKNWIESKRTVISKYASHHILNSDHCSFQQEYVSPRTLSFTGERTTEVAVKKKHNLTHSYTVQPVTSADGHLLNKFFLILQEEDNEFGKRVQKDLIVPPNVVVRASKLGKSTIEKHHVFLNEALCPLVGRKFLLFLDSWKTQADLAKFRAVFPNQGSQLLIFPEGSDGYIQPQDLSLFRSWRF
ncbi:unnamed protein product, partial [Rotaria sp. Silwood1]